MVVKVDAGTNKLLKYLTISFEILSFPWQHWLILGNWYEFWYKIGIYASFQT